MNLRLQARWACALLSAAALVACSSDDDPAPTNPVITLPEAGTDGSGGSAGSNEAQAPETEAGADASESADSGDGGAPSAPTDGGPAVSADPRCASGAADAGCSCILTSTLALLNQCTSHQCQPYDNGRIKNPLFVAGQPLPPVP